MSTGRRLPLRLILPLILLSLFPGAGCTLPLYVRWGDKTPAHLPPAAGSPADAKAASDAAREQIDLGNYAEALRLSRQAVALDPTLAEAHKNLALALCDQGKCDEALAPAKEAVRLRPDFDKAHLVLGKVLFGLGLYRDAVAEYNEALRINGEYDKAFYNLGVAYDRLGDASASAEALRQALRLKPQQRDYRERLALALKHVSRPGQPAPPLPLPSADFKGDGYAFRSYDDQVRDYLYHNEFDLLERAAAEARAGKERVPGGYWKLDLLYGSLDSPAAGVGAPDAEWQYHVGKLKKWAGERPSSVTARVALADAYVGYAWQARGEGVASTVTEEGWQLFRERLALSKTALDDAKGAGPICPQWYSVMMTVARGQGWDRDSYDRLFGEATAFEPSYTAYYLERAQYLLPRWHGRPGEWVRFAEEAAERVGGREGSALYYQVARSVAEASLGEVRQNTFMSDEGVSWPRVRQGLADLEQACGASSHDRNLSCLIAVVSGDAKTGRELFEQIGDNWDASVWRSRAEFEMYKDWAHGRLRQEAGAAGAAR